VAILGDDLTPFLSSPKYGWGRFPFFFFFFPSKNFVHFSPALFSVPNRLPCFPREGTPSPCLWPCFFIGFVFSTVAGGLFFSFFAEAPFEGLFFRPAVPLCYIPVYVLAAYLVCSRFLSKSASASYTVLFGRVFFPLLSFLPPFPPLSHSIPPPFSRSIYTIFSSSFSLFFVIVVLKDTVEGGPQISPFRLDLRRRPFFLAVTVVKRLSLIWC